MINRDSPLPIYYQLKELIKKEIETRGYGYHTQIASEADLSEKYNISRMTVRQAINCLVNEGAIYRIQGKGTFVAPPKVQQNLAELTSFTQEMSKRGMKAISRVLSLAVEDASPDIRQKLNSEKIIRIHRVRLGDGEPIGVETSHILYPQFKFVLVEDLSRESLYQLLANKGGVKFSYAIQMMQASVADEEQAQLLNIQPGAPILVDDRLTFMEKDIPFEYVEAFYRGDRYRYEVKLVAPETEPTEAALGMTSDTQLLPR